MERLRRRLDRLEQEAVQHREVLIMPDGAKLHYSPEEAVAAFTAAENGENHWLIEPFVSAGKTTGIPGLVRSLALSRELVEDRR